MIIGAAMLLMTPVLGVWWINDGAYNAASTANSRKHFSRPSFAMWVDKEGELHVKSGPDLDHSTRTQNSMRDWYEIERRLKWYPWIWFGLMFLAFYTTTVQFISWIVIYFLVRMIWWCVKRMVHLIKIGPKGFAAEMEQYRKDNGI